MRHLKRIVRKLIPDWVMARYRLKQYSKVVRWNMDVFVSDLRRARRLLAVSADTVRARVGGVPGHDGSGVEIHTRNGEVSGIDPTDYLADPIEVVVVGALQRPRRFSGRRTLPDVMPSAIAAAPEVFEEVGGRPTGDSDLKGLHRRVLDAGFTVGVVPIDEAYRVEQRSDPIDDPAALVVSAVPVHDVGGGSRAAQLALELVRRGFHVTFVSMFPAAESVDLGLRFVHPRLEQVGHAEFEVRSYLRRVSAPGLCLLELPISGGMKIGLRLKQAGFRLVYDLIDDWSDPELGGAWYRRSIETTLLKRVDLACASAPDLVLRLERMGAADALLVPNAVNADLFGGEPGPTPDQLIGVRGKILGYHGSLYGNWFDWEALGTVARANPDAEVIVIGDIPRFVPEMPGNVRFLGLKPQKDLPGHLARFDVGLIPFHVTETTHAVSPLKVFEYLAMGVPVAAPPLRSLEGLDGVHTRASLVEAVGAALDAPRPDRAGTLERHSWQARLDVLLESLGIPNPARNDPVRIVVRPVRHYEPWEREVLDPK